MWVGGQKKSNQPVRTAILHITDHKLPRIHLARQLLGRNKFFVNINRILLVVLLNQIILRHIIHDIKYIHNSGTLTPSASTKDHTNGRI